MPTTGRKLSPSGPMSAGGGAAPTAASPRHLQHPDSSQRCPDDESGCGRCGADWPRRRDGPDHIDEHSRDEHDDQTRSRGNGCVASWGHPAIPISPDESRREPSGPANAEVPPRGPEQSHRYARSNRSYRRQVAVSKVDFPSHSARGCNLNDSGRGRRNLSDYQCRTLPRILKGVSSLPSDCRDNGVLESRPRAPRFRRNAEGNPSLLDSPSSCSRRAAWRSARDQRRPCAAVLLARMAPTTSGSSKTTRTARRLPEG